jgi:LmbE family N-acetylglucosaminyl deacetylase
MKKHSLLFVISLIFLIILGNTALSHAKILVLSPHPDDDTLIASGIVYQAIERGEQVRIVYMTNGDKNSVAEGYTRQGEAVAGQAYLGVPENQLIFLGYPDGYIDTLYNDYPAAGDQFTAPNGRSTTYGNQGLGGTDYHYYRFSSHAKYNSYNIVVDLQDIITSFKPGHVFTTSEFDQHPDHSTTYMLLKQAILNVHSNDGSYVPTLHDAVVWSDNYDNWPNLMDPTAYFTSESFSAPPLSWNDRESIDVPLPMQSANEASNPKYQAISAHESQLGMAEFLYAFIHKDEIFWTENIVGTNQPPVPDAGLDQTVNEGDDVYLDGSGSYDPDGAVSFQWSQIGGTAVSLVNATSESPYFTAPTNLTEDETLTFQLIVNDGSLFSIPDSVNITVQNVVITTTTIRPTTTTSVSTTTTIRPTTTTSVSTTTTSQPTTTTSVSTTTTSQPTTTTSVSTTTTSQPTTTTSVSTTTTSQPTTTTSVSTTTTSQPTTTTSVSTTTTVEPTTTVQPTTTIPAPGCLSVIPASAKQGAILDVTITGAYTSFSLVPGESVATFSGSGITVNSTQVNSATEAVANITIDAGATVVARDVTITTGDEKVTCPAAFTINAAPVPTTTSVQPTTTTTSVQPTTTTSISGGGGGGGGSVKTTSSTTSAVATSTTSIKVTTTTTSIKLEPSCLSITPPAVDAGATADVAVAVQNIDLTKEGGITVAFGCAGITVNSVIATSATHISANVTVADDAPQSTGNITVTDDTGTAEIICENAFTVNAKPLITVTVNPGTVRSGFILPRIRTFTITGLNSNWDSTSVVTIKGIDILIPFSRSKNEIRALALVPSKMRLPAGSKTVTVTTGNEISTGNLVVE